MSRQTASSVGSGLIGILSLTIAIATAQAQVQPRVVFEDRFEGQLKAQWSARNPAISTTPAGQQRYLGPFGPEAVELKLTDLPEHQFVRLSLDLLVTGNWEGNKGPDLFTIQTDDGRVIQCTSLGWNEPQAFPGFYGVHTAPPLSGAIQNGNLGFIRDGEKRDAVYHLEALLPHHSQMLGLRFVAATDKDLTEATWGITRISVSLDGVTPSDAASLAGAWQMLGAQEPAFATAAVWTLVGGGDASVRFLQEKLRGESIPANLELLDLSHATVRAAAARSGMDPFAIDEPAKRRIALAAFALQAIGSPAAREMLNQQRATPVPALHSIKITVREASSGQPLRYRPLSAEFGSAAPNAAMLTDAQGQATLDVPVQGDLFLNIFTAQPEYVPTRFYWYRSEVDPTPPESADLLVERGTTIGGLVVDDSGQPVEGASVLVRIDKQFTDPRLYIANINRSVKTDRNGSWLFNQAPAEFDTIRVGVFHPLYALPGNSSYPTRPFSGPLSLLRQQKMVLVLQRGVPIIGVVVAPDGKPVPSARVFLGTNRVVSNTLPEQPVDQEGRFFLAAVPNSTATITVRAPGYAPAVQRVDVGEALLNLRFDLQPPSTIKGRVIDPNGNGIAGATVSIRTWRGGQTLDLRITANENGAFTWAEAPDDAVAATFGASGYGNGSVSIQAGQENIIVLQPRAGPRQTPVSGTVVDDQTGEPIKRFTVITGRNSANGALQWQLSPDRSMNDAGRDGRFGKMLAALSGFTYVLRIEADGYLPSDSPPFDPDGQRKSLEFRLKRGENLKGSVFDTAGAPIAGALIVMVGAGQTAQLSPDGLSLGSFPSPSRKSDGGGAFSFPPQAWPFDLVVLHEKGFARVSSGDLARSEGRITLQEWGKIDGVLKVKGELGAQMKVQAQYSDEQAFPAGPMPGPQGSKVTIEMEALTDSEGKFRLDRVPPRTVQVGKETVGPLRNPQVVTPQPGETVTITITN